MSGGLRKTSRSSSWWGIASTLLPGSVIATISSPACSLRGACMGAERPLGAVPGVGLEGERLGRRAGLAGDDPERRERVEVVDGRGHGRRVGRVEDAQRRASRRPSRRSRRKTSGARLLPPIPPTTAVVNPASRIALAEALERGDLLGEVGRRVEPAEALGDRRLDPLVRRPEGRVAVQEALGPLLVAGPRRRPPRRPPAPAPRVRPGAAMAGRGESCRQASRPW